MVLDLRLSGGGGQASDSGEGQDDRDDNDDEEDVKVRNDPAINIRILMRYNGWLSGSSTAEEFCICNPDWQFGCIAIFSVDQCKMSRGLGTPSPMSPFCSGIWVKGSLFAHEFGHALGRATHDSEVGWSIECDLAPNIF